MALIYDNLIPSSPLCHNPNTNNSLPWFSFMAFLGWKLYMAVLCSSSKGPLASMPEARDKQLNPQDFFCKEMYLQNMPEGMLKGKHHGRWNRHHEMSSSKSAFLRRAAWALNSSTALPEVSMPVSLHQMEQAPQRLPSCCISNGSLDPPDLRQTMNGGVDAETKFPRFFVLTAHRGNILLGCSRCLAVNSCHPSP